MWQVLGILSSKVTDPIVYYLDKTQNNKTHNPWHNLST